MTFLICRYLFLLNCVVDGLPRLSLYRGLLPVLSSLYCSNFLYFYTFNGLKTVVLGKGNSSSSLQDLLFGYLAGDGSLLSKLKKSMLLFFVYSEDLWLQD